MRKHLTLFVLIFLSVLAGWAVAHNQQYQGKAFTFHSPDQAHVIDVTLEGHNNELHVMIDTVEIGTRTNFCTPVN
jgi:cytochrome b561